MSTKNTKSKQILSVMKTAQKLISKLAPKQKAELEKGWDIEHAYYDARNTPWLATGTKSKV